MGGRAVVRLSQASCVILRAKGFKTVACRTARHGFWIISLLRMQISHVCSIDTGPVKVGRMFSVAFGTCIHYTPLSYTIILVKVCKISKFGQ